MMVNATVSTTRPLLQVVAVMGVASIHNLTATCSEKWKHGEASSTACDSADSFNYGRVPLYNKENTVH